MANLSVNAGLDFSVNLGSAASFHGSAKGGFQPYIILWDFGDGTTSTGSLVPSHVYKTGKFTATLKVTDAKKRSKSDSCVVTVGQVPVAPTGLVAIAG